MSDRLAAERACKDANPIIDGRKANVNLAYLGAKPRGNLQAGNFIHLVSLFNFCPVLHPLRASLLLSWSPFYRIQPDDILLRLSFRHNFNLVLNVADCFSLFRTNSSKS